MVIYKLIVIVLLLVILQNKSFFSICSSLVTPPTTQVDALNYEKCTVGEVERPVVNRKMNIWVPWSRSYDMRHGVEETRCCRNGDTLWHCTRLVLNQ